MPSITTRVRPAATCSPGSTRTSTMTPGMGAANPPAAPPASGGENRGSLLTVTVSESPVRWTRSPSAVTAYRTRRLSHSTSSVSGDQAAIRARASAEASPPTAWTMKDPSRSGRYETVISTGPAADSTASSARSGGSRPWRHPLGIHPSVRASRLSASWSHMAAATAACWHSAADGAAARLGSARSMKSVVVSPARKASERSAATRKWRLVVTPPACRRSKARARRPAASVRLGAWAMTLASIGS